MTQHGTARLVQTHLDDYLKPVGIQGNFEAFHRANPQVYRTLCSLVYQWTRRKGYQAKLGIGMLFEHMRWELAMRTTTSRTGEYKLNNNYRSRYVRLMLREHPEWKGLFELRELKAQ